MIRSLCPTSLFVFPTVPLLRIRVDSGRVELEKITTFR